VVPEAASDDAIAASTSQMKAMYADGNVVEAGVFVEFCPEKKNPFHTCLK
jgi:hypothetical protein